MFLVLQLINMSVCVFSPYTRCMDQALELPVDTDLNARSFPLLSYEEHVLPSLSDGGHVDDTTTPYHTHY